jgi:hypothetical protein
VQVSCLCTPGLSMITDCSITHRDRFIRAFSVCFVMHLLNFTLV